MLIKNSIISVARRGVVTKLNMNVNVIVICRDLLLLSDKDMVTEITM